MRWKPFKAKNIRGSDCDCYFSELIDLSGKGSLISKILNMTPQQPIDLEQASRMAHEKYEEARKNGRFGYAPGECFWYLDHFVEWISCLGYHIELTGDEFEPFVMSSQIQ